MQRLISAVWPRVSLVLAMSLTALVGCSEEPESSQSRALGDPETGQKLIVEYGCDSCHQIPGIVDAIGVVGPPLEQIGKRKYIAGKLRNTPSNVVRWLMDPQEVEPGTVMPDLGLTEAQASDIAAYLYTMK